MTSENGSLEKRLIKFVIEHVNRYVRKFFLAEDAYCLTLDGHSSREGWQWLQQCKNFNCAVVQSPSRTTHFLQPCDQQINKLYKKAMRNARENTAKDTHLDTRTVQCGLMVGTAAFHEISVDAIKKSLERTGLWPMDYRFLDRFSIGKGKLIEQRLDNGTVASRINAVTRRHTDRETFTKIKNIFEEEASPCLALRAFEYILHGCRTVNRVLMEAVQPKAAGRKKVEATRGKDLSGGTPAIYLTVDDLICRRREKEVAAAVALETKKREAVEKEA